MCMGFGGHESLEVIDVGFGAALIFLIKNNIIIFVKKVELRRE